MFNIPIKITGRHLLLILALMVFSLAPWPGIPTMKAIVMNADTGEQLAIVPVRPGSEIIVSFINSVEHLPVSDIFEVSETGSVVLSRTVYMAPYIGYVEGEQHRMLAPGMAEISGIHMAVPEVSFWLGRFANHKLQVNDHFIDLYDHAPPGSLIVVRISKSRTAFAAALFDTILGDKGE